jgi:hypothetical protein
MLPHEVEDLGIIESLTGVGVSELDHRHLSSQVHAAAQLLLAARDAGMELDRAGLPTEWDLAASPEDLAAWYGEESELTLGE